MTSKQCPKCDQEKPLAEFPRHRGKPLGVYSCCKSCKRWEAKANRLRNGDGLRKRSLNWYYDNRDRAQLTARRWKEVNPQATATAWRRWYAEHREQVLQRQRDNLDPAQNAYRASLRRARLRRAVPSWADLEQIRALYQLARRITKETGTRWVVDHDIPLKHPLVSGLHVETNLRLLPYGLNAAKGNRWNIEGAN